MRIVGITIPEQKRIDIGLTAVFGVGRTRAKGILGKLKIDPSKKPKEITLEEENAASVGGTVTQVVVALRQKLVVATITRIAKTAEAIITTKKHLFATSIASASDLR